MSEPTTETSDGLIGAIQRECQRVRDELLPAYNAIGPAGTFGAAMLKLAIQHGESAIAQMDVVAMVKALTELRGCE